MKFTMFSSVLIILSTIFGGMYWHYNLPSSIASSPSRCFEFFGIDDYSYYLLDELYSEGKEWDSFGSKIYWYGNFSSEDLNNLKNNLSALGATNNDSIMFVTQQVDNIMGTATLILKSYNPQLILSYEEI